MNTPQGVYDFLLQYINSHGGPWNNWYVGIATNPEQRLFGDHNVQRTGAWAYDYTETEEGARAVEKALLTLGLDGGIGGGITPKAVYVYKKSLITRE